ncbi:MAG: tRNA lysidine(34) synthetase TilS [Alkalinema sp. CAN_BIN05]|nr:tRNA lysidine(34) synthetase TilS [Alkalinema sp. CAN_BIN05]
MPWTPFHAQVHQTLRDRKLLPSGAKILIAVSGGQDSLCLAQLLLDLQPLWDWNLSIVHCDHRWRSDSSDNARHVQLMAQTWELPYHEVVAELDVSTEAKARNWRYESFITIANTQNHTHIAVGHTATDRAETLIYNLARGSGAEGMQALGWSRLAHENSCIQVIRPLLAVTRTQTGDFCRDRQLPIWHDTTNDDLAYRRNRIRQQIIPLLQDALNPQADRHLAQTAELLTADVLFLQQQSQILYGQVVENSGLGNSGLGNYDKLHRHKLSAAPLALQRRVLRLFCKSVLKFNPTFEQIEDLTILLTAPSRSQSSTFKGGAIGMVLGDYLTWRLS